ncbi:MAG: hypothetical protein QXW01_03850, partial [Candidatus Aenigmatarchaeota archaeon]
INDKIINAAPTPAVNFVKNVTVPFAPNTVSVPPRKLPRPADLGCCIRITKIINITSRIKTNNKNP